MVHAARPAGGASSLRHDAVLEAVASTAERLLLAVDWREVADEVLGRLGTAAGVSRAYVIENRIGEDGRLVGTMRHEWCAPGVPSLRGDPVVEAVPWDGRLDRWAAAHARGEPVSSLVAELPEAERTEIEAQDIVSIAEQPVFVGDGWWGVIGFDDRDGERRWGSELDALRAAATVLGAAIARHRIEHERRKAEHRWQQVIEHIPAVTYTDVVVAPGDVRMDFVSPQMRTILGYEPEHFLEDPGFWFELIDPEDLARLEASGVLDSNDVSRFDEVYRMRAADGSVRWIHDTSTPVFRDDGSLDHFLGFMIDVTERMRAQEHVRQAEERYRLLVERTPAITYTESVVGRYDPMSAITYLSPQIETVLGYPLSDWQQRGFWMRVTHPDDRDDVMAESARTSATGEPYRQEYRMIANDGRVVWIHDESVVAYDSGGRPLYWQGVMMGVTERKRAEEQLRQAEERYRALIEHIPAVVYRESPEGDPAKFYISPQVHDLFGYTPEEWTWTPDFWRDGIHPDDQALVYQIDDRSNETKDPYSVDYRFRHADGRWIWVHDEATFLSEGEEEGYWQGFLLDSPSASTRRISSARQSSSSARSWNRTRRSSTRRRSTRTTRPFRSRPTSHRAIPT